MTDVVPAVAPVEIPLPSPAPDNPEEALSWLGGTVEEVAEGLRARGIKGVQREAGACPLARYLQIWWPNAGHACISWTGIDRLDMAGMPMSSAHVRGFELSFDDGAFPDLIAD